jgi:transposase
VPRVDDRRVISGISHVLKSGCRGIDAPPEYGPRKTLYNRFVRWADKGIWVGLFDAVAVVAQPPLDIRPTAQPLRDVERVWTAYLGRRCRLSPAMAAVAADDIFVNVRL